MAEFGASYPGLEEPYTEQGSQHCEPLQTLTTNQQSTRLRTSSAAGRWVRCRRDFHITPSGTGRSAAINQWAHSSVQHCSPTRYNQQLEATSDKRRSHFSNSPGHSRTRNTFCILKQSPLSLEEQRVFTICSEWQDSEARSRENHGTSKHHYEQSGISRNYEILLTKMKIYLTEIHGT